MGAPPPVTVAAPVTTIQHHPMATTFPLTAPAGGSVSVVSHPAVTTGGSVSVPAVATGGSVSIPGTTQPVTMVHEIPSVQPDVVMAPTTYAQAPMTYSAAPPTTYSVPQTTTYAAGNQLYAPMTTYAHTA